MASASSGDLAPPSSLQPLRSRLQNILLLPISLPGLIMSHEQRTFFREAQAFVHALPDRLQEPLPIAIKKLDGRLPPKRPTPTTERTTRNLADLAVLLHRRSPLGLCLRRSVTRYYFLRREGLPLTLHFGARFINGRPDRDINGHAWLTLDGSPYHESGENWRGFTVMLTYPRPQIPGAETTNNDER
ncbi:MAG: lasso peptide biosynthesis B2 protein [Candidatus Promineifilaceae bacterium]